MTSSGRIINGLQGPIMFKGRISAPRTFADILIEDYLATELWKLTDITSGTTILASVNSARNGTLSGWTLQSLATPIVGETGSAPLMHSGDTGNILSSSLVTARRSAEGTFMIIGKVTSPTVWTTGSAGALFFYRHTPTVFDVDLNKQTSTGFLRYRLGGGSLQTINDIPAGTINLTTNWFMVVGSYKEGGLDKVYWNGSLIATKTNLSGAGSFSAPGQSLTAARIGERTTVGGFYWEGYAAYHTYWNKQLSDTEVLNMYNDSGL